MTTLVGNSTSRTCEWEAVASESLGQLESSFMDPGHYHVVSIENLVLSVGSTGLMSENVVV
jgi:hypothetical protein